MKRYVAAAVVVLGLASFAAVNAGGKGDKDKLQGSWEMSKAVFMGKEMPAEDKKKSLVLVFDGDKVTAKESGKPDEQTTYKIDETKKPAQMTVGKTKTDDKEKVFSYKLEGDTLTFAMSFAGDPPTTFDGKEGVVLTFKRVTKK